MNSYGDRYVQHQTLINMGDGDDVIVASVKRVPGDEDAFIDH